MNFSPSASNRLQREFFTRPSWELAPELIGTILVQRQNETLIAAMITETEAYGGEHDRASHTFPGQTKRNASMYLEGGHLYVYRSYGIHLCMNIVSGLAGQGQGVLIRSVHPLIGLETLLQRRGTAQTQKNTFTGPGKVGQALGVSLLDNGRDLTQDPDWWLQPRMGPVKTLATPRIGISKSVDLPWRWVLDPDV